MKIDKRVITVLKYAVALIPVVWIFSLINPNKLSVVLKNSSWWTIPIYLLANIIAYILQGTRWWMLMHGFIPSLNYTATMRCHLIGLFYSIILPSSASQDLVRTVLISRKEDYGVAWAASWLTRLTGMLSLFLMSIYGFLQYDEIRSIDNLPLYIALFCLAMLFLLIFSFSKRTVRFVSKPITNMLPHKLSEIIKKVWSSIYIFKKKKMLLLILMLMTLTLHIVIFSSITAVIWGITGEFKYKEVFAFAPIIEFLCMVIPITPNGMGIRELLSKEMFDYMGLSEEQLGVYVIVIFISIAFRLFGGIPLLFPEKQTTNHE